MQDWCDKYRPKTFDQFIGNETGVAVAQTWVKDFASRKVGTKRGLLLTGPCGVGKTTLARLILNYGNYRAVDIDASDTRTPKILKEFLHKLSSQDNVTKAFDPENAKDAAVIIDDIESLGGSDKSSVAEVLQIINPLKGKRSVKKADKAHNESVWTVPVIAICGEWQERKVLDLRKDCLEVCLEPLTCEQLHLYASAILAAENRLSCLNHDMVMCVISCAGTDVRRLLLILQELCMGCDFTSCLNSYCKQSLTRETAIKSARSLLSEKVSLQDASAMFSQDKNVLPLLIHENYPKMLDACGRIAVTQKANVSVNVMKRLGQADHLEKIIFTHQTWDMYVLAGLASTFMCNAAMQTVKPTRTKISELRFTSMINRISLQHTNTKHIETMLARCSNPLVVIKDLALICQLCQAYMQSNQKDRAVRLLAYHQLSVSDIDKIVRADKMKL